MKVYADLHIHIGRTEDKKPVKITAADSLTVENVLHEAVFRKGIGMVGIVDAGSPGVQRDLEHLLAAGKLQVLPGGGLTYMNKVTLILGMEVETGEMRGSGHFIVYFPTLELIRDFSAQLGKYITNLQLSTQRVRLRVEQVWDLAQKYRGLLIPAHVFTPFKSVYGSCCNSLSDIFRQDQLKDLKAVELGLSSDTRLGEYIGELDHIAFLSNSDAHSLGKIAREYNLLQLNEPDFQNLAWALEGKSGCRIIANFGLDPKLGKYHRTFCDKCGHLASDPPPVKTCPNCGSERVTVGVLDRITELESPGSPQHPPYVHQIPLQFLPGLGKKTLDKLLANFGTEMNILHQVTEDELQRVVGPELTKYILKSRTGTLKLSPGGGGIYGRVVVH